MYILIEFLGRPFGTTLQQLNRMLYNRLPKYIYECTLFVLVYKQLVQTKAWKKGVNEKTFLARSPKNPLVGLEHDGKTKTYSYMFNMIIQDGTRSDNSFTWKG